MDIKDYFQSYENYFWEWTTDEDVPDDTGYNEHNLISIPEIGAIVYRPYLIEVLKELSLTGLPLLSPLLLVLYATNDGYTDLNIIKKEIKKHPLVMQKYVGDWINPAFQFLETLKSLPGNYKKGRNRILLLQTIFTNEFNAISVSRSEYIINRFLRRPQSIADSAKKIKISVGEFSKDVRVLANLNNKFPTTESIIEAMKGFTDISELEDEVVEEETTVETDKDFIQELIEEPKTFQVGSLIKRIWSGLKIPMRHLSPGEQPIGGISDMTNKGELHRMLLSEFANEDDIFMNRVANNEALFIQREIPPEENIFERIILIDTSLKNWGTPKVLAFASAIAVIKHPKAHSECKVFALGQNIIPISLDKVDEVVENLNHVSPVLEVSGALEKFFNEEHKEKDLEVFFITNQENLSHQNLQKIIHENRDRLKFLVTTSANGELNFYKHHKGTRKHIQKIMLPLQELWANPPQWRQRENKFSGNGKKANVPFNYPILFPAPINKIATFLYEGEFFILSNKKQLLRTYLSDNYYNRNYYDTYKTHHGCEVLIDDISVKPKGQFALAKNKQGDFILCQYQPDKKLISKLNLSTKEYSELNLTGKNIPVKSQLIYFNKSFYLHLDDIPYSNKIAIDGNVSFEEAFVNEKEIYKNNLRVGSELNKLIHSGLKILNNFHNIGINTEKKLVISNNELNKYNEDSITFYRNNYPLEICAEQNKNKFTFSDGSEIITDNRGMLTFKSSNKNIPEFYIPSTEYGNLALATNTEFGGSEYYLPQNTLLKVRTMEEMYVEYMERFIDQIWEYGT